MPFIEAVQVINFIKFQPLIIHLVNILWNEMGRMHEIILPTEVPQLS